MEPSYFHIGMKILYQSTKFESTSRLPYEIGSEKADERVSARN
jgi:hypothetical protein